MGATDMFSETLADFSTIPANATTAPRLFMSEVIQKAFIAVDEEGTEAAAATGFCMGFMNMSTLSNFFQNLMHLV